MWYIDIIVAAIAAYIFGAIWYTALSKPWMKAAGLTQEAIKGERGHPSLVPFIVAAICVLVVASMMHALFSMANISTWLQGIGTGLCIGLFVVLPWIITNYAYGMRPFLLTLMDGGYAVIGCSLIGLVLGWF